jgi:ABC-type nickel/cobalt efflux system permease component RcnA
MRQRKLSKPLRVLKIARTIGKPAGGSPMRRCLIAALFFVFLFTAMGEVTAHPLGNFSISQYSAIRVDKETVEIRYIIDMAEIPTFQEIQETGIVPQAGDSTLDEYLKRKTDMLGDGLILEINGLRLTPLSESREIIFPPGAGGLPTMKIGILYKAKFDHTQGGEYLLSYRDGNFPGRAGWKEIIAVAASSVSILNSSVPETDRSSRLNDYPTDLLNSPPQQLEAKVAFTTASGATSVASTASSRIETSVAEQAATASKLQKARSDASQRPSSGKLLKQPAPDPIANSEVIADSPRADENNRIQLQPNRQTTPSNSFTDLVATKQLGLGIILVTLAVAVGLGAFHALEPGHGKTLVAAYLVGSRGTVRHAFLLGLIVTAAHTVGVYLLGALTLYASQYVVPERLYPWLGVISGVMIASLGAVLLVRRYLGKDRVSTHHHHNHADHSHGADHFHHHDHDDHFHHHGHTHHHHDLNRRVPLRDLLALGISGGIVPCPAALVVLLSAVSMQRIGFGLLLIVAFSIGLAAVLIAIGLLMVYAREFMSRFHTEGLVFTHWLPLASSTIITLFGFGLMIQSVASAGYFAR